MSVNSRQGRRELSQERRLEIAQRCAEDLYRRGARRVRLFGSLAHAVDPDELSDVDLAVEGLARELVRHLRIVLSRREGVKIDVIRLEDATPGFRKAVLRGRMLSP